MERPRRRGSWKRTVRKNEGRLLLFVLLEVAPVDFGTDGYDATQKLLMPVEFDIRQPTPVGN